MQQIGKLVKHINRKRKIMTQTETYQATVKGVKDIHDDENPVKYWLSVELENGMDRRLYVDQNCRHIQKGQKVTVTGYPIKKPGSNNQTCVKIETDGEAPPPAVANATARSNGAKSVSNTMDVWKEKYRLTMSNLLSAAIQSGKEVDYDQIDGFVRKILDAKYDGDEAPF
tara:strand:- start:460 stop:969 length:510 start_codon:yes stop_codon:yes gene_type:complete